MFREEITLATICLVFEALFSRLFPRNTFSRLIILLPSRTTLKIFHSRWNAKDLLLLSRFYLNVQLTTRRVLTFGWYWTSHDARDLLYLLVRGCLGGTWRSLFDTFQNYWTLSSDWSALRTLANFCDRSPFCFIPGGQKQVYRKFTKCLNGYLWSLQALATAACLFVAPRGRRRGVEKSSNQLLPLISVLSLKCASKSALLIESITR